MAVTKLENLIDPQVMAPMISGKLEKALMVTPFAKIDRTLVGQPGDTVTVPKYAYIGDAEVVAEGVAAGTAQLTATTSSYAVHKAVKAVTLTDEAVLSGYGNPVGETNNQIAKAIASKIDQDAITALLAGTVIADHSADSISYNGIVDSIGLFNEEVNEPKVIFIAPAQVTTLRKDANFISADKYNNNVIMTGEIGMIANARVVATRRVVSASGVYSCPIVQLASQPDTEDETPALTIFLKKDLSLETQRNSLAHTTDVVADKHYLAALTNDSKVVVAKFLA